jgi:CDP-diacylglycerol--serine O-phosphatidyltransferase
MGVRKHIPNTITSMNLLCGVLGVIAALGGRLETAFLLMLLAAVMDFFDGFAARLLKVSSAIGKELDSLADDVSFGVLPAIMLYCISGDTFLKYIPLLIAAFSALRLAKFNLDERQHSSFLGLPTPACAMICGGLAVMVEKMPSSFLASWCSGPVLVPVLSLVLCWLLVCEIPMFAMKVATGDKASRVDNVLRIIFFSVAVLSVVAAFAFGLSWAFVPFASFLGYAVANIAGALFRGRQ